MNETSTDSEERSSSAPGATAAVAGPAAPASTRSAFPTIGQYLRGDLGQLPVFVALLLIAAYFQFASGGFFLEARNLSELVGQIITIGIVALGAVLVLLIGEIDLSLAAVAYLSGAVMVVCSARLGYSPVLSVLIGLLVGVVIGIVNGIFVSVLRMPSFIVTLAGLIGYQGLLLHILLPQTTTPLRDEALQSLARYNVPDLIGVGVPILGLVLYAGSLMLDRRARTKRGLPLEAAGQVAVRVAVATVLVMGAVFIFESYQGVPLTALILVGLIVFFWLLMRRTSFGRHIYAIGGNAEAARRAGINVVLLRGVIFALAAGLAAVGGILQASRQVSASSAVDSQLLLNAIAAAVLGGVSLFGGRGSVWSVVLGALIVGSLINGLALTGQGTDVEQMVEGAVLLIAVLVDALARRRNATGVR